MVIKTNKTNEGENMKENDGYGILKIQKDGNVLWIDSLGKQMMMKTTAGQIRRYGLNGLVDEMVGNKQSLKAVCFEMDIRWLG